MDIGFGLIIGVVVGAAIGFLVVILVSASRKGIQKVSQTKVLPNPQPVPQQMKQTSTDARLKANDATRMLERETKFVEAMTAKENKLGAAVTEVRDLVLRVADIVSRTNDASGEAAKAFSNAKTNLASIDINDSDDLLAAHAVLLKEINSVISTNAKLQDELESANNGIAQQRRQIEELRNAVRVDALTQLSNRAAFDERIQEFLHRLDRTDEIFSLLLLDIDHFKKVNDTYGHVNGDRILKGIAQKIKVNIRGNDIPARYGGEEFAVIFPDTRLDVAQTVAERMREDIAKTNFKLDDKIIKVTISGGLAECTKSMKPEDIIGAADKALYASKNGGRNCINCGPQIIL